MRTQGHDPSAPDRPDPRPQTTRRRVARRLGAITAALALALTATVTIGGAVNIGERLAFFPTRDAFTTPSYCEDVTIPMQSDATLHGWFIRANNPDKTNPDSTAPAVLFTHGNAGNIKNHGAFCEFLADAGFHVLLFDYRGYGRSTDATPTRRTIIADAQAAYDYLRARPEVDPDRIGVYGMSMGGQPALHIAARNPEIRAVATLSTFSTWDGIASDFLPVLGPLMIDNDLSATQAAAQLGDRPYWIGQGESDSIINARHAPILHQAAADAGVDTQLHLYPNGNHISLLFTHPESRESLTGFFREHLAPPGPENPAQSTGETPQNGPDP